MSATASPLVRLPAAAWMLLVRAGTPASRRNLFGFVLLSLLFTLWLERMPPLVLPVLFLWGIWMPRVAVLHREAHLERLPGLGRAMALALAVTLAPLIHVACSLGDGGWWLMMIVAIRLVIGFSTWRSCLRAFIAAVIVAAATQGLVYWGNAAVKAAITHGIDALLESFEYLPAWSLSASALAAWQWRRLVRRPLPPDTHYFDYPLVLNAQAKLLVADEDMSTLADLRSGLVGTLFGTGQVSGLKTPVRAMRTWLGRPFAPMARLQILMRLAALGFVSLLFMNPAPRDHVEDTWSLVALPIVLAFWLMPFLHRIRQLGSTHGGDRDELALLPGWRSGADAHRVFLRALLVMPVLDAALVLSFFGLILAAPGEPVHIMPDVIPVIAMTWMAFLLGWPLIALLMLTRETWWVTTIGWAMIWANIALCVIWFLDVAGSRTPCLVVWIALLLVIATSLWRTYRRFRKLPHPFVSQ